jgi:hypothetical protein
VAEKDNSDANKRQGNGGLNKYDGHKFYHFPIIKGFFESDVHPIYKDSTDDLWISTTGNGVYKYVNSEFIKYNVPNSAMSFLNDRSGNI